MKQINDLQAGKAGEYLVCADLILKGYIAFLSEQGLHYDVVIDSDGLLVRVQVKTTRKPQSIPQRKEYTPAYRFNIRRMGKGGRGSYNRDELDVFALVALDTKQIGYLVEGETKQTMDFRIREFEGKYFDERKKDRRKKIIEMRDNGKSFAEIGRTLGLDKSQAHRIFNGEGAVSKGRYLDEFPIERAMSIIEAQMQPSLLV